MTRMCTVTPSGKQQSSPTPITLAPCGGLEGVHRLPAAGGPMGVLRCYDGRASPLKIEKGIPKVCALLSLFLSLAHVGTYMGGSLVAHDWIPCMSSISHDYHTYFCYWLFQRRS